MTRMTPRYDSTMDGLGLGQVFLVFSLLDLISAAQRPAATAPGATGGGRLRRGVHGYLTPCG